MAHPKDKTLSVTYQSPTNEAFTITKNLPAPPSASITDRTASLAALRQALSSTQEQINKELTERMEQDKARDGAKTGSGNKAIDDVKEEENYGEEVQDED